MMEGDFGFEDDFFESNECEENRVKTKDVQLRQCDSEWFHTTEETPDKSEEPTRLKFCGDWAYRRGHYTEALDHYKNSLVFLGASNVTLRREVGESQTRCYAALKQEMEAVSGYRKLRESSSNFEQTSVSLQVGVFVFSTFNRHTELVETLHQLLLLHPGDCMVWLQLTHVYGALAGSDTVTTHRDVLMYVAALYRTKALLEQSCRSSQSFVLETHRRNLSKVIKQIESCDLPLDVKNRISGHMCGTDQLGDTQQAGDDRIIVASLSDSEKTFHSLWFPWLDDCLATLHDSTG